jgi:hypothetical protein
MTNADERDPDTNLEAEMHNLVEDGGASEDVPKEEELGIVIESTQVGVADVSETAGAFSPDRTLEPEEQEALLGTLKSRFETHRKLHDEVQWADVEKALRAHPDKLWSLQQLERTGGEPDVIGEEENEFIFGDCSAESPPGRRNVVFDREGEDYEHDIYPTEEDTGNAADLVAEFGVDFMDTLQYRRLQSSIKLDECTWSWLKTPPIFRNEGFGLYGFRDKDGAGISRCVAYSRYESRAFRCSLRVPKT